MSGSQVFQIIQMIPNSAKHHKYILNLLVDLKEDSRSWKQSAIPSLSLSNTSKYEIDTNL